MTKRKLEDLELTELKTKANKYHSLLIGGVAVIVTLSSILLYLIFKTELFALLVIIPGMFLTIILPSSIMLGKIKAEMKNRNNNQ